MQKSGPVKAVEVTANEELKLPDARGHFGPYGGRFVAETLMGPLEEFVWAKPGSLQRLALASMVLPVPLLRPNWDLNVLFIWVQKTSNGNPSMYSG